MFSLLNVLANMLFRAGNVSPTPPISKWVYENLLGLDPVYREKAQELVQSRLPNYSREHCVKLFGGSPYEFLSRCVLDENGDVVGVMAFCVGKLNTVEIVAFVAKTDGIGIGRFLMESFVTDMKLKKKSSILTYIEPSAFPFFSRFEFSKQVPARSLYEKITSKYVAAIFMYRNLLEPITELHNRPGKNLKIGDRLLVTVDGTLIPRQALVKDIRSDIGMIHIHYFFWNPRHDEWIYTHSPRIRFDLPLPPEPPKNKGENSVTVAQVKGIVETEMEAMKKVDVVTDRGYWPKEIKRGAVVQVRIEGEWIAAKVISKNDHFCYCSFEYNGSQWHQDFPRESIRLITSEENGKTILEILMERKIRAKPTKRVRTLSDGDDVVVKRRKKGTSTKTTTPIELSPFKSSKSLAGRLVATAGDDEILPYVSDRALRKQKRDADDEIKPLWILTSPGDGGDVKSSNSPETVDTTTSSHTCSVCDDSHGVVLHCTTCEASVHPSCYMMDPLKPLSTSCWNCDICVELKLSVNRRLEGKCICCNKTRKQDSAVMAQTLTYKWIHVKCALMLGLEFFQRERRFDRILLNSPKKGDGNEGLNCISCNTNCGTLFKCMDSTCSVHAHAGCMNDWNVKVMWNGERDVKIFCPPHAK